MSSQEQGITLYSLPEDTSYRLIELPPELQTLMETDDPPVQVHLFDINLSSGVYDHWLHSPYVALANLNRSLHRLKLESSDTAALLRAPNKTYALRQKNTSNALILLKPHVADPSSPQQGLATISTIHETVELDVAPEEVAPEEKEEKKPVSSKGKWHERFGRTR